MMSYKEELQKLWTELLAVNQNVLSSASQANVSTLEERMIKEEEIVEQLGIVNNDLCGKVAFLEQKEGELVNGFLFQKTEWEADGECIWRFHNKMEKNTKWIEELEDHKCDCEQFEVNKANGKGKQNSYWEDLSTQSMPKPFAGVSEMTPKITPMASQVAEQGFSMSKVTE